MQPGAFLFWFFFFLREKEKIKERIKAAFLQPLILQCILLQFLNKIINTIIHFPRSAGKTLTMYFVSTFQQNHQYDSSSQEC